MDQWIWMRNATTGGTAKFPAGVEDAWAARGWAPCPEPVEDDQLSDGAAVGAQQDDTEPAPEPPVVEQENTAPAPDPVVTEPPATPRSKKEMPSG